MKAIVGLGNPGDRYSLTRHNVGFEVIDYMALKYEVSFKFKHKALIGSYFKDGEKILIVKPQTFMNLSGESIVDVLEYYNIDLKDTLIIYDDIDLDLGKLRIRQQGSAGSHNGMKSVIYHLNSDKIPRLRLGIGVPENLPLVDYVLQKFNKDEIPILREMVIKAEEAVTCYIAQGINCAMNQYNK